MTPGIQPTIFALSSGNVRSGVAVIRISGPNVRFVLETTCGFVPDANSFRLSSIRHRNGDLIDRGLVAFFAAPKSFTGEDCGELHVHGGRAVVAATLNALSSFEDCRLAEAGEFTRRAYEAGKVDLIEVEGLADLVAAETDSQRRLALEQTAGLASTAFEAWAGKLVQLRSWLEAELDFPDEEDVPGSVAARAIAGLIDLRGELANYALGRSGAEVIRSGFRVVLTGAPNVGKSSLLNALAGRDVAIVSAEEGTTRDIVSLTLDLNGCAVILTDTAGLRDTESSAEQEGVRRAVAAAAAADLMLYLVDERGCSSRIPSSSVPLWRIRSKADLQGYNPSVLSEFDFSVSATTGHGVDKLLAALASAVAAAAMRGPGPIRERHLQTVREAVNELDMGITGVGDEGLEVLAEHLRRAQIVLDRLTGRTTADDVLGAIFAEFCVGK